MTDGRIFRAGVPRELTEDAEVRRLYLGDKFRM
jgi:ABC-type lipopolysaccharide export system ATPase subunit